MKYAFKQKISFYWYWFTESILDFVTDPFKRNTTKPEIEVHSGTTGKNSLLPKDITPIDYINKAEIEGEK